MNNQNDLKKSLAKVMRDEKGWRRSMATTEGSYSRDFVQGNLLRLEAQRELLLGELTSLEARRNHVMNVAIAEETITDYIFDGICEQLVTEGWLTRAPQLPQHQDKATQQVYAPTEKAVRDWHNSPTE